MNLKISEMVWDVAHRFLTPEQRKEKSDNKKLKNLTQVHPYHWAYLNSVASIRNFPVAINESNFDRLPPLTI